MSRIVYNIVEDHITPIIDRDVYGFHGGMIPVLDPNIAPKFAAATSRYELTGTANSEADFECHDQYIGVGTPPFVTPDELPVPDLEGLIKKALYADVAPWYGSRKVTNWLKYSQDVSQWGDTIAGSGLTPVVVSLNESDPLGGNNAARVQFDRGVGDTSTDFSLLSNYSGTNVLPDTHEQTLSVWVKSATGVDQKFASYNGYNTSGLEEGVTEHTATREWTRFHLPTGTNASKSGVLHIGVRGGTPAVGTGGAQTADLLIFGSQLEITMGQTNKNPSVYVPTISTRISRHQANLNGNVVDPITGIVTNVGDQPKRIVTNKLSNSEDYEDTDYWLASNAVYDPVTRLITSSAQYGDYYPTGVNNIDVEAGDIVTYFVDIEHVSGSDAMRISTSGTATTDNPSNMGFTALPTEQRFTRTVTITGSGVLYFRVRGTDTSPQAWYQGGSQFEINSLPSEYVRTTSGTASQAFTYANGNTVVTKKVVESQGADYPIVPLGAPITRPIRKAVNLLDHSNEFSDPVWINNAVELTSGVVDPNGGFEATTVTATSANGYIRNHDARYIINATTVNSIWIRRRVGTGQVNLVSTSGTGINITSALSSEWVRVSSSGAGTFDEGIRIQLILSGDAVDVAFAQLEDVSLQDNQAPSEYVPTGASPAGKLFTYANGNSVTDDVVTEAQGASYIEFHPRLYGQQTLTNILWNGSRNYSTWTEVGSGLTATPDIGIDGTPDGGSKFVSVNVSTSPMRRSIGTITPTTGPVHISMYIKKDGDESSFPSLQILSGANGAWLMVNKRTGDAILHSTTGGHNARFKVLDKGKFWRVFLQVDSDGVTTQLCHHFGPGTGVVWGTKTSSATGYATFDQAEIHPSAFDDVLEALPIFTIQGSSSSQPTLELPYDKANHNDARGVYSAEVVFLGQKNAGIMGLGSSGRLMYYTADNLRNYDGGFVVSLPESVAVGQPFNASLVYDSDPLLRAMCLNGVWADDLVYDGGFFPSLGALYLLTGSGFNGAEIASPTLISRVVGYDLPFEAGKSLVSKSHVVDYGDDLAMQFDIANDGDTLTIPAQDVGTFDATIFWGDGEQSVISTYDDANLTHTYAREGAYIVRVRGSFPNIYFNNTGDKADLIKILNFGDTGLISLEGAFYGCANLTTVTGLSGDTSNVTSLRSAFDGCIRLVDFNALALDTSSVENMLYTFRACTSLLSLDLYSWNTSSLTNLAATFENCSSATSIETRTWNTPLLTGIHYAFNGCDALTYHGADNWDIESISNFEGFMAGVTLDRPEYDKLLIAWAAQDPTDSIVVDFGLSVYTSGGLAQTAREKLVDVDLWTIVDGGYTLEGSDDFAMVFATTAPAETVTIPCQNVGTFNAIINWGDDSESTITSYNDADLAHEYASAGNYVVRIRGTFPSIQFYNSGDKDKLKEILQFGDTGLLYLDQAFFGCTNLTKVTATGDTSGVMNMSAMFRSCTSLVDVDLTSLDTSSSISLSYFMHTCSSVISVDMSSFDTSNVTNISQMFRGCALLETVTGLDNWNTHKVTTSVSMFYDCDNITSVGDLSSWDTSKIVDMNRMFWDCESLIDVAIDSWNIEAVTDFTLFMTDVLLPTARYDATLVAWGAQNVKSGLNIPFGRSKYSAAGSAARAELTGVDGWTITDGGTIYGDDMVLIMSTTTAFESITIPCQNVGTFNAVINWDDGQSDSTITSYNDADLTRVYQHPGDHVIRISGTFPNIYFNNSGDKDKLKQVVQFGDTGLTRLDRAFYGCTNLISIGGGVSNIANVTSLLSFAESCTNLETLGVSVWDVSSVTTISTMLFRCSALLALDVSGWVTTSMVDINHFVRLCPNLTVLDVSGWDTGLITNITNAFADSGLSDLAIDGWDVSAVTSGVSFLAGITLPTSRYDATMIAWAAQVVESGVDIHFGNSQYSSIGWVARQSLIDDDSWVITDGGLDTVNSMILVMETTGAAETITVPCQNAGTFNAEIDWGDGEAKSLITTYNDADLAHEYAIAEDHTITITGAFPNIYFVGSPNKDKLKEVINLGDTGLTTLYAAFFQCGNLTAVNCVGANISAVTTLNSLFRDCNSMVTPDVSGWDTSNVTNMYGVFYACNDMLTPPDISNWDTAEVLETKYMFLACSSMVGSLDLSSWDTSKITNMFGMFQGSSGITDLLIDGWNIEAVTDFTSFITSATLPTARYDATLIAWAAQIANSGLSIDFGLSTYTPEISGDARNSLAYDDGWAISDGGGSHNDMVLVMATTAPAETVTIPCQNVGTFNANIDWGDGTGDSTITAWNDGDLAHEYADAGDHIINISGTFPNIFFNDTGDKLKLKGVLQLGDTGLTRLNNAFRGCSNLLTVTGVADISGVTSLHSMFRGCTVLLHVDTSSWDTFFVSTFNDIFLQCGSLLAIDASGWNLNSTTELYRTFFSCTDLASIGDVSGWDTSNITTMTELFYGCSSLVDVAIDSWDVEALTNATSFMLSCALPTARYDATLIAWAAQNVNSSLHINFGSSQYSSVGSLARASLTGIDLWTITDGGTIYDDDMVLVMGTTGAAETVTIPCETGTFNATIDWGDDEPTSAITTYDDADLAHEYADAGDYAIRISGTFPNIKFNNGGDKDKLKEIIQFGDVGYVGTTSMFYGCSNLIAIGEGVSVVPFEVISNSFRECTSLVTVDANSWDVSAVTNFSNTFQTCSSLVSIRLDDWVTTASTSFYAFLYGCSSLAHSLDLSGWDMNGVNNVQWMFYNTGLTGIGDVSSWDTSDITNFIGMMQSSSGLGDVAIDEWDISAAISMDNFMAGHTLPTFRYDATLIAWAAQIVTSGLTPSFGGSTYTAGGAAEAARTSLENDDLWVITDGGPA